jgi:hypothetical protein
MMTLLLGGGGEEEGLDLWGLLGMDEELELGGAQLWGGRAEAVTAAPVCEPRVLMPLELLMAM